MASTEVERLLLAIERNRVRPLRYTRRSRRPLLAVVVAAIALLLLHR
jgi:hypothetical protein